MKLYHSPKTCPSALCPGCGIGTVHVAHGPQQEGGSSGAVLAVEPAVKPVANCLLGQLWGVGMAAGQCSTCLRQGRVSCWGIRDHPNEGFFPHLDRCFLASLDAMGVMFHTLQWHSTGTLPLNQARRIRAGNREK